MNSIRYETKSFTKNSSSDVQSPQLSDELSKMSLTQDGGKLNLSGCDEITHSTTSSMQRLTERKTITTSSESRMDKKSQQHSYRLE